MKATIIAGIFTMIAGAALAQEKVKHDPTYSVNNYKHSNKADYARKHNLDGLQPLSIVTSTANRDYKHPGVPATPSAVGATEARKMDKSTRSYKHPNGL